ncbi:CDP-alcohol phosphatidyltransferase family protein [Nocardioides panacisoli]|uniref:CDP-alcohol phosphatidyltransferase family protein n=1 Tax=Nocardioides panacisoli TaxID=627624 RepID=UPI001C63AC8E|nr:CDP-alcohol phosphatidyltransferase family protein [Nocardioides panacisoli]QYJ04165.1 CDP-alcohol phosphatidyltransferase family protein [Nocardioides panacisoli]
MFDVMLRRRLDAPLARAAAVLDRPWVTPDRLTVAGLVVGLASAGLAAGELWGWALATWLVSRALDGLDGPLARRRGPHGEGTPAGGFLDISADFLVYGVTVVGVAVGVTSSAADLADWLPFAAVLVAYYVNGTAFLAFSSIAEGTGHRIEDGRSLSFLGGIAEGGETILVHALWLLLPWHAPLIAAVWAAVVGVSAGHRIVVGYRTLRRPAEARP